MSPLHLMTMTMGASALMLAATQLHAQGRNCGPHDRVTTHLAERFGEARQMIGLATNRLVVEIYASSDTGTWTIIATRPDGVTCLVASGTDADVTPQPLPNTDPDA